MALKLVRQAQDELTVTQEMVEAGIHILFRYDLDAENEDEVVVEIFREMYKKYRG